MQERFKCFSVKILDNYDITVHSLVCNTLTAILMFFPVLHSLTHITISCFPFFTVHKYTSELNVLPAPKSTRTYSSHHLQLCKRRSHFTTIKHFNHTLSGCHTQTSSKILTNIVSLQLRMT